MANVARGGVGGNGGGGGDGGRGGPLPGAALGFSTTIFAPTLPPSLTLSNVSVLGNLSVGASGGDGGDGGHGGNGGAAGSGGIGGGSDVSATLSFSHVDVIGNVATAGDGGQGGRPGPAAMEGFGWRRHLCRANATATLTDVNLTSNQAIGGTGGMAGRAVPAAGWRGRRRRPLQRRADTTLIRVNVTRNQARGGNGGPGGIGANGGAGGDALGGGIYTADHYLGNGYNPESGPSSLTILDSAFTRNEADAGLGGGGPRRVGRRERLRDRRRPLHRQRHRLHRRQDQVPQQQGVDQPRRYLRALQHRPLNPIRAADGRGYGPFARRPCRSATETGRGKDSPGLFTLGRSGPASAHLYRREPWAVQRSTSGRVSVDHRPTPFFPRPEDDFQVLGNTEASGRGRL